MGVKLGLGLAAVKRILNSRRCSSLALVADAAEKMKSLQPNKQKSIYLCFLDTGGFHIKQIVRPLPWDSDGDKASEPHNLTEMEVTDYKDYDRYDRNYCSTFASLILFPCGLRFLHTFCVDTSTRPLKFQSFSYKGRFAQGLTRHVHQVRLGEVDSKLYRIDNHLERFLIDPDSCAFQVFDPQKGKYKWSPLPTPPFINSRWSQPAVLFLDVAKKIIGWDSAHGVQQRHIYWFDTTKPEIGWTYLGYDLPIFRFNRKPFLVHNHDSEHGDFYILFEYEPRTLRVSAFFISSNFVTTLPTVTGIYLPAWFSDYTKTELLGFVDFEFLHLGARNIALVLHRYVNEHEEGGEKPGSVLVVAFEYELTRSVEYAIGPILEINTRSLRTRRFQYQYDSGHYCDPGCSSRVALNGAFLL